MKTISIRQPWASLICAGIKDVENRTWKTNYRGKLLIHAGSAKCPDQWGNALPYVEWQNEAWNAYNLGSIDWEVPTKAIIGYVDLIDCAENKDWLWGQKGCYMFELENAYMFDEPILNVNGKLNIYETDLDENNLPPAHKVVRRMPNIEGDVLVLPVRNEFFDNVPMTADNEGFMTLYQTPDIMDMFLEMKDDMVVLKELGVKNVKLVAQDGRESMWQFVEVVSTEELDSETGKPMMGMSVLEEETEVWCLQIVFK